MGAQSDTVKNTRRRLVRFAGWSGVIWTVFQLTMLALSKGQRAWDWQSVGLNVLPVFVLAVATLRGSFMAAIMFGVYGAYRLVSSSVVFVRWLNGTAAHTYDGLVWEIMVVMVFAIIWIVGGISGLAQRHVR
jgi:hypothetical protein